MPISFACPNGHRLTCPDQQAGKPGKCPKCGAVLHIPQLQEAGAAASAAVSAEATVDSGETIPLAPLPAAGENPTPSDSNPRPSGDRTQGQHDLPVQEEVVFLCPNGHRLHSPASLVGRPGKCPHCGARFLVPSPDEEPEDDAPTKNEPSPEEPVHQIVVQNQSLLKPRLGERTTPSLLGGSSLLGSKPGGQEGATGPHPLATLFGQLWACKAEGATIEVHLGDGKLLIPDEYARHSSPERYALFAVKEANGTHTLTAVAWDAITRIALRGLAQLPQEWFEG